MLATFDHTALDRHDINLYLELGIYRRDDFEFAAVIIQKIINWFGTRIHRVTYEEYQELFDHVFGNYDWSRSFTKTQVIYSDDLITPDTLIHFHEYLRKKCVNIENIMFMICGSQGADEWWQQWCRQAREQSFRVCTWPVSESVWIKKYTNGIVEPNWDNMWQTKILNLTQLFSIYGGSYAKRDRCFLTLRLCELYDYGFVDFMGNFTNKQQLIDYTEHITYFKNQKEVDYVTDLYNQYIDSHGQLKRRDKLVNYPAVKDDKFSTDTMQWYIDQQCIFNIIRETDDSGCFGYFTEKTIRCFFHMCLPLPASYQSAIHIEKLGFWLPHELVNYDYQNSLSYHQRVLGIVDILNKLKNQPDLTKQYFYTNRQKIIDNAKLAMKLLIGTNFT